MTLLLLLSACDDEPGKLFEEAGTWELQEFALDGASFSPIDTGLRNESFFLSYSAGYVQTAACLENPTDTPSNSPCRLSPSSTAWYCQCFAYSFDVDQMTWSEFAPGDAVPPVVPGGDGNATIDLDAVPEATSTFLYQPLPTGVFGSNGSSSGYIFVKRATSLFDQVYADPQGRPSCQPCVGSP